MVPYDQLVAAILLAIKHRLGVIFRSRSAEIDTDYCPYVFHLELAGDYLLAHAKAQAMAHTPDTSIYAVDGDAVIAETTATIRFEDANTREAMRRYIATPIRRKR